MFRVIYKNKTIYFFGYESLQFMKMFLINIRQLFQLLQMTL